jgi:hypothetical protein
VLDETDSLVREQRIAMRLAAAQFDGFPLVTHGI